MVSALRSSVYNSEHQCLPKYSQSLTPASSILFLRFALLGVMVDSVVSPINFSVLYNVVLSGEISHRW